MQPVHAGAGRELAAARHEGHGEVLHGAELPGPGRRPHHPPQLRAVRPVHQDVRRGQHQRRLEIFS